MEERVNTLDKNLALTELLLKSVSQETKNNADTIQKILEALEAKSYVDQSIKHEFELFKNACNAKIRILEETNKKREARELWIMKTITAPALSLLLAGVGFLIYTIKF